MEDGRIAPRGRSGSGDASQRVALQVRSYIEKRELGPGSRVGSEHELAREFGVSRPTLREALRLLSAAHLVEAAPGRSGGIFVVSPPIEGVGRSLADSIATILETDSVTLDELLQARLVMEPPLAALAATRATDEVIAELQRAIDDARLHMPGTPEFNSADRRFHRTIARSVGNDLLIALTSWILDVLQPSLVEIIGPNVGSEEIIGQHEAILNAIKRGWTGAAERAMAAHIEHLRGVLAGVRPPVRPPTRR